MIREGLSGMCHRVVLRVIRSLWNYVDAQVSSSTRAGNAKRFILRGLLSLFTGIFYPLPSPRPLATHREREKFHPFKLRRSEEEFTM